MDEWMIVRVTLERGYVYDFTSSKPQRSFLVGREHTFADLAEAIEQSFGRTDPHMFSFDVADKKVVGFTSFGFVDGVEDDEAEAEETLLADLLARGDKFTYLFDMGDNWFHRCRVQTGAVEPERLAARLQREGVSLAEPVLVDAKGAVPPQYRPSTDELTRDAALLADTHGWSDEERLFAEAVALDWFSLAHPREEDVVVPAGERAYEIGGRVHEEIVSPLWVAAPTGIKHKQPASV